MSPPPPPLTPPDSLHGPWLAELALAQKFGNTLFFNRKEITYVKKKLDTVMDVRLYTLLNKFM